MTMEVGNRHKRLKNGTSMNVRILSQVDTISKQFSASVVLEKGYLKFFERTLTKQNKSNQSIQEMEILAS